MTVNDLLENFKTYYPIVAEDMIRYESKSSLSLTIETSDGRIWEYNEIGNRLRVIPNDKDLITEEEYRQELVNALFAMMRRKGINQLELSEMTGISQPQLSRYMTGRNTPSSFVLRKIARALGCSIDELSYM